MWEEEEETFLPSSNDLVELIFNLDCKTLPLDHAWLLSQAISTALPFFNQLENAGLHLIHVAESGNGWQRPENFLYLSKRTKLQLRIPLEYVSQAQLLCGAQFNIDGHFMTVKESHTKPLLPSPVLFARYVLADSEQSEELFIETALQQIRKMGIQCRKMLAGLSHTFQTPNGELFTRSLMLADLSPEDSLLLQNKGLGEGRTMGLGLFVPHKNIKAVGQTTEKKMQ
ncbi:MAG: hypothetical protein RIT27_1419 [Pseudomonadota bacterium]|jgi:CRISPR-associated protein Cas6